MREIKKSYRIWDIAKATYVSVGYKSHSSWNVFPSAVIKANPQEFKDPSNFEVHEFNHMFNCRLSLDKKAI